WTKNFAEQTLELNLATPPGVPVTVRVAGSAPLELPHGANGRWVFPLARAAQSRRRPARARTNPRRPLIAQTKREPNVGLALWAMPSPLAPPTPPPPARLTTPSLPPSVHSPSPQAAPH